MSGSVSLINGHIDPDKGRMTDKEIIKALECCGKNHIAGSTDACEHCFLQNSAMCVTELIYKTLDLINRQQAEIERLRKANGLLEYVTKAVHHVKIGGEDWMIDFKTKEAMFEEINKKIDTLCNIQTSRAEAIKEFWEKLWELDPEIISKVVSFDLDELNNLKNEMVGEDK